MAEEMKYLVLEDEEYEIVDGAAREAIEKLNSDLAIIKIVSDADDPVALRDLESGTYVLQGKFIAFTGSTSIFGFSSSLLVNIIRGEEKSSVQIFYPTNNRVQFLEITDDAFTRKNVDLSELDAKINDIQSQIDDMNYKAITISGFTNNVNTVEIGSTVTDVTLSWRFSKTPKTVTLDGEVQAPDSTGAKLTGLSITSAKSWTLKATDERGATATKTTGVSFYNGIYYGVGAAPEAYDSAFIRGLSKPNLRNSKLPSFTVNAGEGEYIFYCLPKRLGTCSFTVGGFTGGFELVATVEFTNASGYTDEQGYYVYKSVNAGLGATSVSVS